VTEDGEGGGGVQGAMGGRGHSWRACCRWRVVGGGGGQRGGLGRTGRGGGADGGGGGGAAVEWGAEEGDDKTVGALHHLIEPGITMQPSGGCLPVQQYFNSRRPRGLLCVASQRICESGVGWFRWMVMGSGADTQEGDASDACEVRVLVMLCFGRAAGPLHGASI
jgi:hypothetical protein